MKQQLKLLVFLAIIMLLILGLFWIEQNREPVQFSDVFFSLQSLSQTENKV